jgi:CRP/FNR family transcriptional regulator, cyclic AMP receptor protein
MTHLQGADWLGYLAAMLVFCSFYAKTIVALRLVAITSNMAFIGYALAKGLYPVLILHVVLLPLNCVRLAQRRAMTKRRERENND